MTQFNIHYCYDSEGIAGMAYETNAASSKQNYYFVRDAEGNVVSLVNAYTKAVAVDYIYNAFGACKVICYADDGYSADSAGHIGRINPIRWCGRHVDLDSGFYFFDGRPYDPTIGGFINTGSAESLLSNMTTAVNPLLVPASPFTCASTLDLVYWDESNTGVASAWDRWGKWVTLGVSIALIIATGGIMAGCAGLAAAGAGLSVGAAVGTAIATQIINLAIAVGIASWMVALCGTVAGLISMANGGDFWATVSAYMQDNMVDAMITAVAEFAVLSVIDVTVNSYCFIAGTLVVCKGDQDGEDGDGKGKETKKPIEDVKVGDDVWAYDEDTKEWGWRKVVRLYRNEAQDWIEITTNGGEIVSTPKHKYYLPMRKEWVSAEDLKVGDELLLSTGKCALIEATRSIHYDKPRTTYNFEVEGCHNYCVGENGVLVHNKGCGGVSDELTEIAEKYDNFECVPAANEMQVHLESKGLHGARVEVRSVAPNELIVSDTFSRATAISTNGYHVGINYAGLVYDNIHKTGISYALWQTDFFSRSGVFFPPPKPF